MYLHAGAYACHNFLCAGETLELVSESESDSDSDSDSDMGSTAESNDDDELKEKDSQEVAGQELKRFTTKVCVHAFAHKHMRALTTSLYRDYR
jgi:hypothetical protein